MELVHIEILLECQYVHWDLMSLKQYRKWMQWSWIEYVPWFSGQFYSPTNVEPHCQQLILGMTVCKSMSFPNWSESSVSRRHLLIIWIWREELQLGSFKLYGLWDSWVQRWLLWEQKKRMVQVAAVETIGYEASIFDSIFSRICWYRYRRTQNILKEAVSASLFKHFSHWQLYVAHYRVLYMY